MWFRVELNKDGKAREARPPAAHDATSVRDPTVKHVDFGTMDGYRIHQSAAE